MDKDRIKGKVKEIEGKAQVAKGKITGSTSDKIMGTAKEIEGVIQHKFGKAKDAVRKADHSI